MKTYFGKQSVYAIDLETNSYTSNQSIPMDKGVESYIQSWCFSKIYSKKRNLSQYIRRMAKNNEVIVDNEQLEGFDKFTYVSGWNQHSLIDCIMHMKSNSIFYFANGAKFDHKFLQGYFIKNPEFTDISGLPEMKIKLTAKTKESELDKYLHTCGFEKLFQDRYQKWHDSGLQVGNKKFTAKIWFAKKWRMILPYEFKYLIKDGKTYQLTVGLDLEGNNSRTTAITAIFKDFYLLFPPMQSLAATGKSLNRLYHTNVFTKLPETYINRTFKDKEDFINRDNGEHYKYVFTDVRILMQYILESTKLVPFTQWKLTIASTAINQLYVMYAEDFLRAHPTEYVVDWERRFVIEGKSWAKSFSTFGQELIKGIFQLEEYDKMVVDVMSTDEFFDYEANKNVTVNEDINSKYYFGGITYVNEDHRYNLQKSFGADISSSYPTQMMRDFPLPKKIISKPELIDECDPFGDISSKGVGRIPYKSSQTRLFKCIVGKAFGSKKFFPFIRTSADSRITYRTHFKPGEKFYCTGEDLKLLIEHFPKLTLSIKLEYAFRNDTQTFFDFFHPYLYKWYGLKQEYSKTNEVLKKICKLFCNSIYGKFGTKTSMETVTYNEMGESTVEVNRDKTKFPLILAVVITDFARLQLAEGCANHHKDLIYTDTDSMTFVYRNKAQHDSIIKSLHSPLEKAGFPEAVKNLGEWDIEQDGWWMLPRRTKQYFKISPDLKQTKFVFAGLNMKGLIKSNGKYLDTKDLSTKTSFYDLMHGTSFKQQTSKMYFDRCEILTNVEKIVYKANDFDNYNVLQEQDITKEPTWDEYKSFDRAIRKLV